MGGRKDDVTRPLKPSRNRPLSAVLEEFELDDHDHKGSTPHLQINNNNNEKKNNNSINSIDENDVNANGQDSDNSCQSSKTAVKDPPDRRPCEHSRSNASSPCNCALTASTRQPLSSCASHDSTAAVKSQKNPGSPYSSRKDSLRTSDAGSPNTPRKVHGVHKGGSNLNGEGGGLSRRGSGLKGEERGLTGSGSGPTAGGSRLNDGLRGLNEEEGGLNKGRSGRGGEGEAKSREENERKSDFTGTEGSGGGGQQGTLEGGEDGGQTAPPTVTLSRSGSFKRPDNFKTGRRQALAPPTLPSPTSPRPPTAPVSIVIHTASDDEDVDETLSPSDMTRLKQTAARLHLSTRRPSTMQWKAQYVERPQFPDYTNGDMADSKGKEAARWTAERTQRINTALNWIRNELLEMRAQDQSLARQLLTIRNELHQVKLARSCEEHRDMLDDVQSELEELQEFADVLDLPIHTINDSPLKHLGVTRMNFSARRFSTC